MVSVHTQACDDTAWRKESRQAALRECMWEYVYYVNTQVSSCDLGRALNVRSSQSAQ